MKSILYISNIEVPYRTNFFNHLSQFVNLTVLYERKNSNNRNEKWAQSINANFKIEFLNGIKVKNEFSLDLRILKYVFSKEYDNIIIGCYNSPIQMISILFMRIFNKKFILNLDGECFLEGNNLKQKIKRFFIKGAEKYLIAGEKPAKNLSKYVDPSKIFSYHFSSLTKNELKQNERKMNKNINNTILVIGQYYNYKGLDIALNCAKNNSNLKFKFIGSGKRSDLLIKYISEKNIQNVEVIPFLNKEELYKEYQTSLCLVLPSRKECWGLVINEAASFGLPIVATYGSGAAIDFLSGQYDIFLSKVNDIKSLNDTLKNLINYNKIKDYKKYLVDKSKKYYIEENVEQFLNVIN